MLYQTVISWSLDSTYNQSVAREAPRTCPEERSDEGSFCKSSNLRDPSLRFGTRRRHDKRFFDEKRLSRHRLANGVVSPDKLSTVYEPYPFK